MCPTHSNTQVHEASYQLAKQKQKNIVKTNLHSLLSGFPHMKASNEHHPESRVLHELYEGTFYRVQVN